MGLKAKIILLLLIKNLAFASTLTEKPILTVYGHNSLVKGLFNQKTEFKKKFEEQCLCTLNLLGLDSSGVMLSRVSLEAENTKADVVIGFDMNQLGQAEATGLFQKFDIVDIPNFNIPIKWDNKNFLPYAYGYFSFIYNKTKLKKVPKSFYDLIYGDNDIKIILQDPRSSSVGFGMVVWLNLIFGDETEQALKKMRSKILTITKSWGEAYSLFLKGEADMVATYTTSPAYHMINENNYSYESVTFSEGHYLQIEVIGKIAKTKHPELADMFIKFILSEKFQRHIPLNDFIYPVIDLKKEMPEEYNYIKKPEKILFIDYQEINLKKKKWFKEWLKAIAY